MDLWKETVNKSFLLNYQITNIQIHLKKLRMRLSDSSEQTAAIITATCTGVLDGAGASG